MAFHIGPEGAALPICNLPLAIFGPDVVAWTKIDDHRRLPHPAEYNAVWSIDSISAGLLLAFVS